MKDFDKDQYPLYKPGHSTSTLIVSMFLAFTIGFVVCHELYKTRNIQVMEIDK